MQIEIKEETVIYALLIIIFILSLLILAYVIYRVMVNYRIRRAHSVQNDCPKKQEKKESRKEIFRSSQKKKNKGTIMYIPKRNQPKELNSNGEFILTTTERGLPKETLKLNIETDRLQLEDSRLDSTIQTPTGGLRLNTSSLVNESFDLESLNTSQIIPTPFTKKISIEYSNYCESGRSTLRGFEYGQTSRLDSGRFSKREKMED